VSTAKAFQQAITLAYQDPRVAMLPPALTDRWKAMVGELMLGQEPLSSDMMTEDGLLDAQRLTEFLDTQFLMVNEEPDSGWVSPFSFERQTMTVRELVENLPSRGKKDQLLCIEDGHCEINDWRPYSELLKGIFPEEVMDSTIVLSDVNPYQWKALKSPLRGVPPSPSPSVTDRMSQVDLATRKMDGQRDPDQGWSACLIAAADSKGRFPCKTQCCQPEIAPNPMGMISGEETAVDIRQIKGKNKGHEVGSEFVSCTNGDGAAVRQRRLDFCPRLGYGDGEVELRQMGLLAEQAAHLTYLRGQGVHL
jgi:hypothetical protein